MITVGADVEGVLKDQMNNLVSSIGLIGGDKHRPFIVPAGNLQEDNVLAEFAIDPASSKQEFVGNIQTVIQSLKEKIGPLDLRFHIDASAVYPVEQTKNRKAKIFGCDPDFDAWTGAMNRPPNPHEVGQLRTCGGHIHVGFDFSEDHMKIPKLIQWMDIYLGLPSVLLDDDTQRRTVYGKSGAFRPKDYGVEYRVLSNFWIKSPELMGYVYDQTLKAHHAMETLAPVYEQLDGMVEEVRSAINTGDKDVALKYINRFNVELP